MPKDDKTWLNIFYVVFTFVCIYLSWKLFDMIGIETNWQERYDQWFVPVKNLSSIIVGIISVWILRRDKLRHEFFLESIAELRKVKWPSFDDTKKMTIVVCIVVGIFAVILAVFDLLWTWILSLII